MPLYFAYGSNMERAAMQKRCPHSRPLGPARLVRHRFFVCADGYASVARDPRRVVWGLLWDLALADVAPSTATRASRRGSTPRPCSRFSRRPVPGGP